MRGHGYGNHLDLVIKCIQKHYDRHHKYSVFCSAQGKWYVDCIVRNLDIAKTYSLHTHTIHCIPNFTNLDWRWSS